MSEQVGLETEYSTSPHKWGWWLLAGLILLLLLWLLVQLFAGSRPLKPLRNTIIPPNITINGQPLLVDFDALNDNPAEYANLRVRVSGNYLRLEPVDCALFSGPRIEWGLVAGGLQLNAQGFEVVVLPIVQANTQMTLEGIWRRYPGPAGCGKEPTAGLWYLEVERIIQPNPLMAGTDTPVGVLSVTPPPFLDPILATATLTGSLPPVGGTPIPNVTIVSTVILTTPIGSPTMAGTAVSGTATPTLPTTIGTATVTPSPQFGTPTAALPTPTIDLTTSPTPSSTPSSGTSAAPTPTNATLGTATPGDGYPVPTSPSNPTPTPYP